jgi:uncharacterized protein YggT (Ycf19 family)
MFRAISTFVSIVITVVELLLSSRLILKFFVANPRTPFVAWVYGVTAPLVSPFAKIHPDWRLSGFVLDSSTLAALIVYVLIGGLILRLLLSPFRKKTDT